MTGQSPVTFVFMADPQLGAFAEHSGLPPAELERYASLGIHLRPTAKVTGTAWDAARLRQAVSDINAIEPAFVVVGGDMTQNFRKDAERRELRRVLADFRSGIAIHWVCGNHDIGDHPHRPTRAGLATYRRRFGADFYALDTGGWRLIAINTCILDDPTEVPHDYAAQLAFLDHQLTTANGRPIGLLGHHPLFLRSPDEPDSMWTVRQAGRRAMLDRIRQHGVRFALAGHRHQNAIAADGPFEMITTAAVGLPFGQDPSGFRVVTLSDDVMHRYIPLRGPDRPVTEVLNHA